jgi:cell division septum initiation protein DivIVA
MDIESIDVENYRFDVVRKGYDRLQVEDFQNKVSKAMARLEERRKLADVRSEKAQRALEETHARAAKSIQETVAARAREISPAEASVGTADSGHAEAFSTDRAQMQAQEIIAQANTHASSIHAEAEAVLAGALSTSARINDERSDLLGSVDATRAELIAEAAEEAEAIRVAAAEDAERVKADAAIAAERIRRQAESDAADLVADARARSLALTATAERQREGLLAGAERAHLRMLESERFGGGPLLDPVDAPAASADVDDLEQVSIDLRDDQSPRELQPAEREPRASRYKSRSANLPHLGDDAGTVIGSLERLRTKNE